MIKSGKRTGSSNPVNPYISLLLKIVAVLILFFLSRIIFYLINYKYYSLIEAPELFRIFLIGIRFDVSAILILNLPFIFLNTIPFRFREQKMMQRILNGYFYLINSIGLLGNFVDMIYFRFTLKRTTADIFRYLGVGGDFDKLVPQFLHDFWYVGLIWIAAVVLLVWFSMKIIPSSARKKKKVKENELKFYVRGSALFILVMFLTIIGIRGGFQLRPISIMTAGKYTSAKNVPLLINTPFAIAKTWNDVPLKTVTWFRTEKELEQIYTPVHLGDTSGFRKKNVMIIIMESFSAEHVGALNKDVNNGHYQGFTPFLDSLIRHSYVVKAFANSKTSIQGIPAVLSSIPSLMNESFIQSAYASDRVISLAAALREKGYTTAFFHGGTNGTMGFDAYTKFTGFDHYYGRKEYNNEKDYDGKWGIRDEEFFQFTAHKINEMPKPFMVGFFSLSSHHPYKVPQKYDHKFREGNLPIQKSVMYSDYSLKRFFETASKSDWFKNTLFVITADHTSEGYLPWYQTEAGQFSIPIIFYSAADSIRAPENIIAQQTDIMPSVFDWLHYDKDYLAFGNSLFDTSATRFSVHFIGGIYGLIKDGYSLQFDSRQTIALFDLQQDPLQKKNLVNRMPAVQQKLELFLKAYIQQYNNRVIENRLTTE
ncbi:MAG: LTA synthase family protein [Syntrophothermus sp.]